MSRQQSCHHRTESRGHDDEREAMPSISGVDASCWTSVLRRSVNDQSRKSSGSSTFGPTEIFWGTVQEQLASNSTYVVPPEKRTTEYLESIIGPEIEKNGAPIKAAGMSVE